MAHRGHRSVPQILKENFRELTGRISSRDDQSLHQQAMGFTVSST